MQLFSPVSAKEKSNVIIIRIICVLALICYLALLVLVGKNARRREQRQFLMFLLAMIVWQVSVTAVALTNNPGTAILWYKIALGLGSSFGLFYAIFVREFVGVHTHGGVIRLGYAIAILSAVWTIAGGPNVVDSVYKDPRSFMWLPTLGVLTYPMGLYLYGFLGYGMYNLARHFRASTQPIARNRLRYLLIGVTLVFIGSIINYSETLKVYPLDIIANVLNAVLIAYAILRFQLLDITLVVRKGLFYSIPAALIGASYFLAVFLIVNILHAVTNYQAVLVSLAMAAITAIVLQPLWAKLQDRLDKYFFREKYDTNLMLQRLTSTASSVLDLDRLSGMILAEITSTMHIVTAALLLREKESGEFYPEASHNIQPRLGLRLRNDSPIIGWLSTSKTVLTSHQMDIVPEFRSLWGQELSDLRAMKAELYVPLIAHGDLVGILVLGPRLSELGYTADDAGTLMTLANQTAIAVQNAWLYQAAIDEKEQSEIILQQAFAGIMVLDHDMQIVAMNPGAETITGCNANAIIGKRVTEVFGPELWDIGGPLFTAIESGRPVAPMETVLSARNAVRDALLGVTPLPSGYLLNFADITQLKQVDRLKSSIVANVSHELRTPLASIKGYTEFLLNEYEGDNRELRRQFLAIIESEADRLTHFINELLDLTRLESGRIDRDMEWLALDQIVRESVQTLAIQADEATVTIHLELPDQGIWLPANHNLMMSAIKNLVSNAIKFSHAGGQVDVRLKQADNLLTLEIADQGLGMSPEDLPYLFTKFYRSESARKAGIRGTGLGLALAKEAIEHHHGAITVTSEVNVGTRFVVTLPVQNQDMMKASHPEPAQLPPAGDGAASSSSAQEEWSPEAAWA